MAKHMCCMRPTCSVCRPTRDVPMVDIEGTPQTLFGKPLVVVEEHLPDGWGDFCAAVRSRLEPFGVEVAFGIVNANGNEAVHVGAGLMHEGRNIRAKNMIALSFVTQSDKDWVASLSAKDLMKSLMTEVARPKLRLPKGVEMASTDRTPKYLDYVENRDRASCSKKTGGDDADKPHIV